MDSDQNLDSMSDADLLSLSKSLLDSAAKEREAKLPQVEPPVAKDEPVEPPVSETPTTLAREEKTELALRPESTPQTEIASPEDLEEKQAQLLAEAMATLAKVEAETASHKVVEIEEFEIVDAEVLEGEVVDESERKKRKLRSTTDVAMRNSNRSFFKEGSAAPLATQDGPVDPTLSPGAGTAEEVEEPVPSKFAIKLSPVQKKGLFACGVLSIAVMVFGVYSQLSDQENAISTKFLQRKLTTGNGSVVITIKSDLATVKTNAVPRKVRLREWKGNVADELHLMQGKYATTKWLTPFADGFHDENGVALYNADAVPVLVLNNMRSVAQTAENFYSVMGRYPVANEVNTPLKNPITKRAEPPEIFVMESSLPKGDPGLDRIQSDLLHGQMFNGETKGAPGAVTAFSITSRSTPDPSAPPTFNNTPSTNSQMFFVHGFDQYGKLISAADSGGDKVALFSDTFGKMVSDIPNDNVASYAVNDLCISEKGKPDALTIWTKYVVLVLLTIAAGSYFFITRIRSHEELASVET